MIGPYRPSKQIIYLDQNFISNIAKAASKPDLATYVQIAETLREKAGVIACPTSEFHNTETLYSGDEELRRAIRQIIFDLSRGLGFRDSFEILESQTKTAIHKYFGNDPEPPAPGWSEAFTSDPDLPTRAEQPVYVEVAPFFQAGLIAKHTYPERARRVASKVADRGVQFNERLDEQCALFVRIAFGPLTDLLLAQARAAAGQPLDVLALLPSYASRVYEKFCELYGSQELAKFADFLKSPQFKRAPFVRIFCSIHTAMEVNSTKPEASDYDDSMILAAVLPYSDVVATDYNKKRLLEELGFDKEFGVTLFSARRPDLAAFLNFLRGLEADSPIG
jgi:hypothetical protein